MAGIYICRCVISIRLINCLAFIYAGMLFYISMPAVDSCKIRLNVILVPISVFVFLAEIRRVVEEIKACIASSSDILDAELQNL